MADLLIRGGEVLGDAGLARRDLVVRKGLVVAEGTAKSLKATLGETVIEFEYEHAETAAKAAAELQATHTAGTVVRLTMNDGPESLRRALNALADNDLTPHHVTLREPTLDDVFLNLTTGGRR